MLHVSSDLLYSEKSVNLMKVRLRLRKTCIVKELVKKNECKYSIFSYVTNNKKNKISVSTYLTFLKLQLYQNLVQGDS